MLDKTEFTLKKPKVNGEYFGNEESGKVVILSHGFGVKRYSRGFYNELSEALKKNYLVILFDYVEIDDKGDTVTPPFSEQVEKLKAVISFAKTSLKPSEINIVAHSQGCIVVGIAYPQDINKVILLSSPLSSPTKRLNKYFARRDGTKIDLKGTSVIKRSDGTTTYVPKEFWKEADTTEAVDLYLSLAKKTKLCFIRPLEDQIVVEENYERIKSSPNIEYLEVSGNHDFDSPVDRSLVLNTVLNKLL